MLYIELINGILALTNNLLDFLFFGGGLMIIFGFPIYFFLKRTFSFELFSQTIFLVVLAGLLAFFWWLPSFLVKSFGLGFFVQSEWETLIRWGEISLVLLAFFFHFGREHGGNRWFYSWFFHVVVIFLGLLIDRWTGILFISLPTLTLYYVILYQLAMVVVPTSNPENVKEKQKRFHVLSSYAWGIQSPLSVVDGHAWKSPEIRIPGDFTWGFSDFPFPIVKDLDLRPGLVWTKSHHVVEVSGGTSLKRIDGPGIVFTGTLERAAQVFDLRLQLRTNELDVVSKDGVSFKARVFTAFRLDPGIWDKETYDTLRSKNPLFRGADRLSHESGSFPFSHVRIQAALGLTSTEASDGGKTIYWDQKVLSAVENATRKVVSQKNLDEMWRPRDDAPFKNALDIIANEIRDNIFLNLRSSGILLVVARIVNFRFSEELNQPDDISTKQLEAWGSVWEEMSQNILSDAQAESEHLQQEAHVYAKTVFLDSVVDGLRQAQDMHPELPRYVIAMRFLSTFWDYAKKQTPDSDLEEVQNYYNTYLSKLYPNRGGQGQ
ncbi:MAG: hypothetical protein L6461_14850 [Anaerolineae bacterium]|nr:hypothetical protein [Anaerolineae bacterium]